ncbi:FAD-binding oxidoreductase [Pleomorphovibrio marinus]|uniref:FAD-binding oxidoreductase n=1 Tax=Pleomorphovibrio marinus TaxID=2164132 RepID=UPI001E3E3A23|nr:FAD-binding oxidoreductase [Pleomorphovibrio marinus]
MSQDNLLEAFMGQLGTEGVLTGEALNERYSHIWEMDQPLRAKALLLPRTTEEVIQIMKICTHYAQPVVMHGGLTNLVGSTQSNEKEVVISLERMNRILELDEDNRTLTVEAGAILENVQQAAWNKNLMFPLNFGAKGSAQIGGAISTNAGGLKVFKYGMTRNLVLGLEVVLADGTLISSLKKLIKDNTGYDLKQLFIGAEGTLGIITKAVLKLIEKPRSRNSALLAFEDYNRVVKTLKWLESNLAGTLSAYEVLWQVTYRPMAAAVFGNNLPLAPEFPYYVLMETSGADQEKDRQRLEHLLSDALDQGMITDAALSDSPAQQEQLWELREHMDHVVALCRHDQHFDISLPIGQIEEYVLGVLMALDKLPFVRECYVFGHMADGNIHLIVDKTKQGEETINAVNEVVYAPIQSYGGSVSAEHGIGMHKKAYLHYSRSPEEIRLMKSLKQMVDPLGILNPGKIV